MQIFQQVAHGTTIAKVEKLTPRELPGAHLFKRKLPCMRTWIDCMLVTFTADLTTPGACKAFCDGWNGETAQNRASEPCVGRDKVSTQTNWVDDMGECLGCNTRECHCHSSYYIYRQHKHGEEGEDCHIEAVAGRCCQKAEHQNTVHAIWNVDDDSVHC